MKSLIEEIKTILDCYSGGLYVTGNKPEDEHDLLFLPTSGLEDPLETKESQGKSSQQLAELMFGQIESGINDEISLMRHSIEKVNSEHFVSRDKIEELRELLKKQKDADYSCDFTTEEERGFRIATKNVIEKLDSILER